MYKIRLLTEDDLEEALQLHLLLFPVKYSMKTMQNFLQPSHLALVLTIQEGKKERIIGVSVSTRSWISFFSTYKDSYLSTFGIHPDFQHTHLGSDLLNITSKILKDHFNCLTLHLHMQKINNVAYNFYVHLGFTAVSLIPGHYSLGDGPVSDAVYMSLDLNKFNYPKSMNQISLTTEVSELMTPQQPPSWFSTINQFA